MMVAAFLNHVWQSTMFALLAGSLTVLLRRQRARVRYWIWFAASGKFLIPFSWLIAVGSHFAWLPSPVGGGPDRLYIAIRVMADVTPAAMASGLARVIPVMFISLGCPVSDGLGRLRTLSAICPAAGIRAVCGWTMG